MEITRRTDYSIRILMELARLPGGEVVSARRLAELQDVPPAFARSIVQLLVVTGFLDSRRGAAGGVSLARPAGEITLLQVVEAMEGPISLNLCTHDSAYCSRPGSCSMHEVWKGAEHVLVSYLGSWDLGSLAAHQQRVRAGSDPAQLCASRLEEVLSV